MIMAGAILVQELSRFKPRTRGRNQSLKLRILSASERGTADETASSATGGSPESSTTCGATSTTLGHTSSSSPSSSDISIGDEKELAEGCVILSVPEDHVVRKREGCVIGPSVPEWCEQPEFGLHEHTIDQERRTLANRHLFKTPDPDVNGPECRLFKRNLKKLTKDVGVVPRATVEQCLGSRGSMKRKRFGGGMERYCRYGVRKQDGYLQMMQKLEFYREDKIELKEDRGIQFRSTTYNAALVRHLFNVEHAVYNKLRNGDGTPVILKGYSPLERGLILAAGRKRFKDPIFVAIDHSRFDAHVNPWLLKQEHQAYLRMRGFNKELIQLLKMQEGGYGFSDGGIVYKIKGKRCSGDLNTALGNCILNWAMLKSYLDFHGIDASIYLDGDDSVLIMERRDVPDVKEFMRAFGMESTVDITDDFEQCEFCQSRIVWGSDGPVLCRNPYKVIDTLFKSARKLNPKQQKLVLGASALCELKTSFRMPVITAAARAALSMSGGIAGLNTPDLQGKWELLSTTDLDLTVDEGARESFAFAWGISVAEQHALEEYYNSMTLPVQLISVKMPKNVPTEPFDVWDDLAGTFVHQHDDGPERWWLKEYALGGRIGG
nr:MAG: RNA-dependent RNA polymerase [Riboviria sp.]